MRNDAGHDAFMEASSIGNVELLKLLIQYGAKPSCVMENQDYKVDYTLLLNFPNIFNYQNDTKFKGICTDLSGVQRPL
jgi:hypothetical protein